MALHATPRVGASCCVVGVAVVATAFDTTLAKSGLRAGVQVWAGG